MFDAPFLSFLAKATGLPGRTAEQRAEIDAIRDELETLKSRSEDAAPGRPTPFDHYIDEIETKCDELEKRCDDIDGQLERPGAGDDNGPDKMSRRLTDAQQRLSIAKRAADARFR